MAQIAEIIKYEGDNSTFVWKYPSEDFNSLTQLIVHESQEALFFMNGQALDLFGPGRYTLETQNLPLLGKILNRATGGESPFHCEVYFINKTVQMGLRWGTDSKVRYIDPDSGIPIEIGASGEMNLSVSDSRKLLIKLIGTTKGIAWEDRGDGFTKSLQSSFRPLITTAVKSNLSQAIKVGMFDILEVDEHLEEISKVLRNKMIGVFEEYGLTIPQFYVTNVVLPEGDQNFKELREFHALSFKTRSEKAKREKVLEEETTKTEIAKREAERQVIAAKAEAEEKRQVGLAEAEVMKAQGITEKDYVAAEVQKAYAEGLGKMGANGGGSNGGSVMSDMIGLGVGLKAAGVMAGQVSGIFEGIGNPNQQSQPADDMTTFELKVKKLTVMKDAGLISDEEFAQMKEKLLAEIL